MCFMFLYASTSLKKKDGRKKKEDGGSHVVFVDDGCVCFDAERVNDVDKNIEKFLLI